MPDATAPTPVPGPGRRWLARTLALITTLAIGIGVGVAIGRTTAASAIPAPGPTYASAVGTARPAAGRAGAGFTAGTIVSITGNTIIVQAADGTQKSIITTAATKVTQTSAGSVSALQTGQTITVVGTTDSSGNVTATSVAEGAGLRGGFSGR
ncbi:MAG: hypothetical protein QOF36_638 [Microbacteriaceae bacterium]|nr:hypothetical protein [Microbacteriaceae bacterium]